MDDNIAKVVRAAITQLAEQAPELAKAVLMNDYFITYMKEIDNHGRIHYMVYIDPEHKQEHNDYTAFAQHSNDIYMMFKGFPVWYRC